MKGKKEYKKVWKSVLWITGMLIFLCFTVIWYQVISYNNDIKLINNDAFNPKVSFAANTGDKIVDKWNTLIWTSDDDSDAEIFTGATISAHIDNNNYHDIKDWTLFIEINKECYLNSFWCGSVIVNQYREGNKTSCFIENQYADFTKLDADVNIYSDSMLIHLLPGDEIVYIPSVREKENIVKAHDSVGIGFILYYQDSFDLSPWKLTYRNDIKLIDLIYTKVALCLFAIWAGALIFYFCLSSIEKKVKEQMDIRIKNISIMSDIYIEAYMVDVGNDSARLIKGSRDTLIADLEGPNVQEKINITIKERCQPAYQDEMLHFLDFSTVFERMSGVKSITTEFIGSTIGWCAVRIFKEENSNNIVITLQDINEEKKKLKLIEERINIAEYKQNISGNFLGTVSFALNDISRKIGMDAKEIMGVSNQDEVKLLADKVMCNTRHMNLIQNTMLDLYNIESKSLNLNIQKYCIRDMLDEIFHILNCYAIGKDYTFSFDVDKSIPEYLLGDSDRIEQILIILLFSSLLITEHGFVSFNLYGKQMDDEEELIFSIRDTAGGFTKEQISEIHEFLNGSTVETFNNASLVYLKIINGILISMNSELKVVSVLNEGTDFYFTLRQGIAGKDKVNE